MADQLTFDLDDFESWFSEELGKLMAKLIQDIATAIHDTDDELESLEYQGFEESLKDKMARDLRALGFDKICGVIERI